MTKNIRQSLFVYMSMASAGGLTTSVFAQSSATPPSEPISTLEKYVVSDVPPENQVLPTVRPIGSVMGDARSILDTPRSVTSVNQAWMDDRQVKNAMDFGQFSPGVYSAAQYGIPAVPFIRGDLGQIYANGQIMPFSRNSTPPSFNGVEAMDIVKGPGSAVYGPQGEGAGGYVNFVTKQPYFDRQHTDISATLGYWTSGHSYSNPELTIDTGGPISDKLAYRVSYLSRYGDGYYLNSKNETQDGYFALAFRPSKTLKIDWWAQLYSDRTNEISGANRVTQKFIDKGTYIGGPAAPTTSGANAFFGYDVLPAGVPLNAPNPFYTYTTGADGAFSIIDQSKAYATKLPAYKALLGPGDTARAKLFQTQLITTAELSPDSKIVNLTYIASGSSKKFETYGYDEYVPIEQSIQNRTEYHKTFDVAGLNNSLIAGFDFRYSRLVSYQDFATEPFSYYDLNQSLSNVFYPGYYSEGKSWGGGLQVPGASGYSAYFGTSGNQSSHIYDYAAFVQDEIKLAPKWSLIAGTRYDRIDADTMNPSFVQTGVNNGGTDFDFVPITPTYLSKGSIYKISDTVYDPSYFLNLVFKPTETRSFYLTYNHVDAVLGSANFGGINVNPTANSTIVGVTAPNGTIATSTHAQLIKDLDNSLTTTSTLYEIGYKESFLHNTLYVGAAIFQQIKMGSEITGGTFPIKDNGLEIEAVYQPNKAITINANLTYQDATDFGDSKTFYQQTGNYLDSYPTTMTVDGKAGTGNGSPNFTTYPLPTGRMRAAGIPQFMANVFVEYKHPSGFGIGIGPQLIGRQYANDQDTLHIPTEYQLDGYLFYRAKKWDVQLNVKNILNSRLLDPIDVDFAGNDTIYVRPPISASVTFRIHL